MNKPTAIDRNIRKAGEVAVEVVAAAEEQIVAAEQQVEAVAEAVEENVEQVADTGNASEQDIALVLGQAAAPVQGLTSSPMTYLSGALGGSLIGGGSSAFVPQVAVGGLSVNQDAGVASVASVDDAVVSIGSVDPESQEERTEVAAEEVAEPLVFEGVADFEAESEVSVGEIASQNVVNNLFNQIATRKPLSIDGVMDNEGAMRVLYGDGAALSDATPVITGTAEANTRLVVRNAAGDVLGLTESDAAGRWSFQLPELHAGRHDIKVQSISLEREEAQIGFEVSDFSGAAVQTASNTTFQITGTEDNAYVFSNADVTGFSTSTNINLVSHITVNSLPADGLLQVRVNNAWRDVVVGERIQATEIRGGNLRFVPDANESGSSAYNNNGVGNQRNLYAELDVTVEGISPGVNTADLTVQVSITPVIDNAQTVTGAVARMGSVAALGAGTWGRYTFNVTGNIGDTDGSERTLIEVVPTNRNTTFQVLTGSTYTAVTPDAAGKIFLQPGQTLFVREYSIGGYPGSQLQYKLLGQEVNQGGDVILSKDLVALRSLQAVQPPPPPPVDPLILDLDGNGVQTSTVDDGVVFDAMANGTQVQVAWTDGKDGFLVLDRNGDGIINDGSELFGDYTPLADGTLAKDGFQALRALDSNADGLFTAKDDLFDLVQVWVDANRDGVTDAGELFGLKELGVQSINLNAQASERTENGNHYGLIATFTREDGSSAEIVDVWLQSRALEVNAEASIVI
jgi:hypothetical protein